MNTAEIDKPSSRVKLLYSIILAICIFLFVYGILFLVTSSDINKYEQLLKNGKATQGAITSIDCANHASYSYEFSVGGQQYDSSDNSLDCQAIQVGQGVEVVYLPADPSINTTDVPPSDRLNSDIFFRWASAVLLTVVLSFGAWRQYKKGAKKE